MIIAYKDHKPEIDSDVFIAEGAQVIGRVRIKAKAGIWYNAVLRGDVDEIVIDEESNVQDCAVFHVDKDCPCIIGKRVTIGHGAIIHGCTIKDGALIGMNATVLDGAVVEEGALIGANALVPEGKTIPAGMLAVGIPAKVLRPLTDEEKARIEAGVDEYIKLAAESREDMGLSGALKFSQRPTK
jgi:carbonic anhydrase/acetyltransferase-like protein (isoleucine patch superfamily)